MGGHARPQPNEEFELSDAIKVCPLSALAPGSARLVPAEENGTDVDITLFRTDDGDVYALDDECTHEEASLADGWIEGDTVECPLHAASFCLRTGAALTLPATEDTATHVVEIREDEIWLTP